MVCLLPLHAPSHHRVPVVAGQPLHVVLQETRHAGVVVTESNSVRVSAVMILVKHKLSSSGFGSFIIIWIRGIVKLQVRSWSSIQIQSGVQVEIKS